MNSKTVKTVVIAGVALVAVSAIFFPSFKGPVNRFRNNVNERLDDEFVVDNYKAEVVSLNSKRKGLVANIRRFTIEQMVAEKKVAVAREKTEKAKQHLISVGTDDIGAFNRAKDAFEISSTETSNLETMIATYSNALVRLNRSLSLVEANMRRANVNINTLETKKSLVDSIKVVNDTVENLNGIGSEDSAISIEKLEDNYLRETLKLEAMSETDLSITDKAAAEEYIKALTTAS